VDAHDAAYFKAMMINWLQVEEFYEDDPVQMAVIQQRCPHCKVIKVG